MSEKKKKKQLSLPPALIILFIVLAFIVVLTWFVPVSTVTVNDAGEQVVHYNTMTGENGELIKNAGTQPAGIWDLFLAPIKGFQSGADVNFSILISGAFLAIINATGAIDAGIGALLKKLSGKKLIAILMFIFAMMGTVYGSCEELPAYALVLIPLCVTAGYDVVTGIMVLFGGAAIGNMASVVNPYATGAAVVAIGNSDLSLGTGIVMRMVLFIVMYIVGTLMVIRYAETVKKNKERSVIAGCTGIKDLRSGKEESGALPLNRRRVISLIIFGLMVLIIVLGYIPWSSIQLSDGKTMYDVVNYPAMWMMDHVPALGNFLGADKFTYLGDWYFDEFSIVFLIGSVLVALVNRMTLKDFVDNFIQGCCDLCSLTIIVAVSRGVSEIMGSSTEGMGITFVYWIQSALQDVPVWAFIVAAVIAYILVGLLPLGTSSASGITMPVLGAVAMALFAGSSIGTEAGQMLLVSAFTVGFNFWFVVYPNAPLMGTLELTNVPYERFLKLSIKFSTVLLLVGTVVMIVSPYLGLV